MRDALSKKIVDIEPAGIRKFFDVVSEIPDAISLALVNLILIHLGM